jgi:hypothetical protein
MHKFQWDITTFILLTCALRAHVNILLILTLILNITLVIKKKIPLDILGWRMCHEEYSKNDGCKIDNEEAENGLSHF